ncbi:transporter [Flavihumibacter petaseus]|uniref:Transporter n=1 Tax=Flavihumibacter petaseus NBRC 106054 TaxID=1220578 RepID=A0A0E9N4R6_9BACT|nr:transporter [Flavihumibacter petaseus]GAO44666.1 hypothetical protein FPE01S_03_07050 [Flavihumibacter petaseus NBRC 106054]
MNSFRQLASAAFCIFLLIVTLLPSATAQELEPRAYANLPKGTNAIALVYGYSAGNVLTDPSRPISDGKIKAHTLGIGYVRTFGLFNKLARVQLTWPFSFLSGTAKVGGMDTSTARNGFSDARIRIGINLLGSPALSPKEFRTFKQKTILGVSLVTSIPLGLYYPQKLINLGANRWGFKPEIGVSQRWQHFYAEAYAGVWFYTDNTSYLGNKVQSQAPVYSFQAHTNYIFNNQMWIGLNGNWFSGGVTKVDGKAVGNLENNWRIGATFGVPVSKQHSLKAQFHIGAFTNTGYDYNIVMLSWQYVFF